MSKKMAHGVAWTIMTGYGVTALEEVRDTDDDLDDQALMASVARASQQVRVLNELTALRRWTEGVLAANRSLAEECAKPLRIKDGKIVSGCLWIPLGKHGKIRKKAASKASVIQAWALKIASQRYDYEP